MAKKIIVVALIGIAIVVLAVFVYRYQILQYSIEKIIRNSLPDYIKIDRMSFDLKGRKAVFKGLRIVNPKGFSYSYLLEVGEITCNYKMRGGSMLRGVSILDPVIIKSELGVERLPDRRVNLAEMESVMEARPRAASAGAGAAPPQPDKNGRSANAEKKNAGIIKLSDVVKLPEEFTVKNGRVVFVDGSVSQQPVTTTFDNIQARIFLKLDDSYSKVVGFASTGQGNLNNDESQVIKWTISLDPNTPRLTMSNRFEVRGLSLPALTPYYDRYSPFGFREGKFSGLLIFDFDNGNIGSTNEIHLSNLVFWVKPGFENARFWETTVPDLARYFTSPYGDIVFDFKIKGDMASPQFYLGPISKQALTSMAIDKISSVIQQVSDKGSSGGNADKVKDYIGLFKALVNKK